jgi:YD repeat-containing protein
MPVIRRPHSCRNPPLHGCACILLIGFIFLIALSHHAHAQAPDTAPPTYRKLTLNGIPDGDKMPQDIDRTDQESEQSFVDALTLHLRHATTDIFVPLATNLPELMVRRNIFSSAWPAGGSLPPDHRPDLPFGDCWTSGLAANIHIIQPDPPGPIYAVAMDEQGMIHTFIETLASPGTPRFCPVPSPDNEQQTTAMSLEINPAGDFIFHRKFGTTLVYSGSSPIQLTEASPESGKPAVTHTWFRLSTISSRAGSSYSYLYYVGNHGLIPDEIAYFTQRIHIQRNPAGQVSRMTDPMGGDLLCEYRASTLPHGGPLLIRMVKQPIDGKRAYIRYDYSETTEPSAAGQQQFLHCDVSQIADPRGKTYQFNYNFDHSTATHGMPRCISSVVMPDASGTSEFFNLSTRMPDETKSIRMTFVRDAADNGILFRFLGNDTVSLDATPPGPAPASPQPLRFAVFKSMEVSYFQGSNFNMSGTNGFTLGHGTKLLGREQYDFDVGTCMGLVQATDLSGNTTRFAYGDPIPHSSSTPANPFAVRQRDVTGCVNALSIRKDITYDQDTRLINGIVDEEGRVTTYQIDSKRGLTTAVTTYADVAALMSGHPFASTTYEYADPVFPSFQTRQTIKKIPSPDSPSWETDLVTSYEPDTLGRVTREIRNPGGLNLVFRYGYDLNENKLFTVYPNGYLTQFTYDSHNNLTRIDRPSEDKPTSESFFDPSGNKIRETADNGDTTTVTEFDALSRITRKTVTKKGLQAVTVFKYAYNRVNSKTLNTTDDGDIYHYKYDGLQRPTKISGVDGGTSILEYGKNCGGALFSTSTFHSTRVSSPDGSQITDYQYDPLYRVTSVTANKDATNPPDISTFKYDAIGNLISETSPDGKTTRYVYDPLYRLVQTIYPGNKTDRIFYTSTGLPYRTTNGSESVEQKYDPAGYVIQTH